MLQGASAGQASSEAAVERHTGLSYSQVRRRVRAGHSAHEHLLRSNYMLVMKLVRDAQRIGGNAVAEEDLCQVRPSSAAVELQSSWVGFAPGTHDTEMRSAWLPEWNADGNQH